MLRASLVLVPILFATTSFALPPGAKDRGFRDGANHRVGDDSFIETFGRAPDGDDAERQRMRTHLVHIRALLANRPATRPELAAKRAELLGYLDDYIAKGTTPQNTRLPWRTPVFIDDHGNICAVGYLIERSVGRALPERIAAEHRFDFLEDIAAAMPEVRAWVDGSGLSLDELASIQPGYQEPVVESWGRVDLVQLKVPDGPYADRYESGETRGTIRNHEMEGTWTRTIDGKVVGKGQFVHGAGTWQSFDPDGKLMARGPYVTSDPHGEWTLFHASGNVAAKGRFTHGSRDGAWRFFYDTPAQTLIASGRFTRGSLGGTWKHFDSAGKLLATSRPVSGGRNRESETLLTIVPGPDGIRHEVHAFGGVDSRRLHGFFDRDERLYVYVGDATYDADGNSLMQLDGVWHASSCGWSAKRKRIARNGDITTLHNLLDHEEQTCGAPVPVPADRAKRIDRALGALAAIRMETPEFVKQLVLGETTIGEASVEEAARLDELDDAWQARDLTRVLAANMSWYVEWPHIDGRFTRLFPTLAGHVTRFTWESQLADSVE